MRTLQIPQFGPPSRIIILAIVFQTLLKEKVVSEFKHSMIMAAAVLIKMKKNLQHANIKSLDHLLQSMEMILNSYDNSNR